MSERGSILALVQRLRDAGATDAMIADVLDTFASRIDPAPVGLQRSAAAERQARYRARKASVTPEPSHNVTSDVTSDAGPLPPNSPPFPSPKPPSHNPPLSPPSPGATARGCTLPADWRPTAKHFAGRDRQFVERQAEAMREWAIGNRNRAVARKADWDATFSGWLRREAERAGGSNRGPPRRTFADIANDAERELFGETHGHRSHDTDQHDGPTLDLVAGGS